MLSELQMLKVTDVGCGMHTAIEMTDSAIKAIVPDYINRFSEIRVTSARPSMCSMFYNFIIYLLHKNIVHEMWKRATHFFSNCSHLTLVMLTDSFAPKSCHRFNQCCSVSNQKIKSPLLSQHHVW